MKRFRGGLVFKAHRLCESLNSRLEGNKEEAKHLLIEGAVARGVGGRDHVVAEVAPQVARRRPLV